MFIDAFAANATVDQSEKESILEQQTTSVQLPYVTLRNRTESNNPADFFGGKRGQLSTGICTVSFSAISGVDEIARSAPFYIPSESIKLSDIQEITLEQLAVEIEQYPDKSDRNIVIYIHGYNTDFEKSCKRSAVFQRALGLDHQLLFFSWPADGTMLKYTWDEADLEWSVPQIAHFIDEVVKRAGNQRVDVVAHSLGARGAVQALARLAYNKPTAAILNELVLIAPDIDTDMFRQELPVLKNAINRVTVYVSENDKALKLSHEVHGYPRLGMAGSDLTVFKGVDTIDISNLDKKRFSGHLYHLSNPKVIQDLTQLLHGGEAASSRPLLKAARQGDLPYWRIMAGE
jgi:esterase/lipase superfamily enzyme